jgi:putative ABC transport system ATP-binding protein
MNDTPLSEPLSIENLSLRFGGQTVLEDFSLQLAKGERVVLQGASGCGKSTLLRCVLGFAVPDRGCLRVFGTELTGESVWKLRQQIAYVPQEPELGSGTAREALERPFGYHANRSARDRLEQIPDWMNRLGLSEPLLDKDISSLSGGEKQRLALVGALLLNRPLLLLDEPTSALDPANRGRVVETLASLLDLTVLAVSHDAEGLGSGARTLSMGART